VFPCAYKCVHAKRVYIESECRCAANIKGQREEIEKNGQGEQGQGTYSSVQMHESAATCIGQKRSGAKERRSFRRWSAGNTYYCNTVRASHVSASDMTIQSTDKTTEPGKRSYHPSILLERH